ncbi:MAG: MFS transporter [Devosia sp.]|nr:MFS transporter [Devosia sp.]
MARDTSSAPFCPPHNRIYVLVAAILASSMGFIDGSVLSIATPALRADLGASLGDAQWVSNAYLLLLSALLLLGGAAGDRFGLRTVFGLGIGLFTASSVAAALAPSPLLLILARAVQGLGAALMVPGSLAIIARAYPREERGAAIGLWSSFSSLTTIMGPVVGGLVLTGLGDWSWRLVFAINLPLGVIALSLLYLKVPRDPPQAGRRLDMVGGGLITLALLFIALGLTPLAGGAPPASHVGLFCGSGVLLLAAFLWWEARASDPMLPLRHFRNVAFSGAQALTFALYFALAAVTFFLPMAMIGGWGATAAEVSLAFLPFGVALTGLSPLAGRLSDRFGPAPMIAVGSAMVAAAFALLGLAAPLESIWFGVLPVVALMGIGMSAVVSPLSTAVMTSVADRETGLASGVNNAVARVAGLLAIAVMGGAATIVFERGLGALADMPLHFGLLPDPSPPPDIESVRRAASNAAFSVIAYSAAALALLSAGIAWLTQQRKRREDGAVRPSSVRRR